MIGDLDTARAHFDRALHNLVHVGKASKQPTTAMCIYKKACLSLQENALEDARSVLLKEQYAQMSLKAQQISLGEITVDLGYAPVNPRRGSAKSLHVV